jgi:beta-galactosidase
MISYFTIPLWARGVTAFRSLRALALITLVVFATIGNTAAAPISVFPVRAEGFTQSLNGDWSFKYIAGFDAGADADFHAPGSDVSVWKTILVPSNWALKGFAEPGYDLKGLQDGLGLYRRTFRVPTDWRGGRRVCLRFEGVAYGFKAWVNGKAVGESTASAYNPHTFDVTDALQSDPKAANVLAVQVTTKPFAYEFDVNDDWSLGGICRDVTLFSVPETHVQNLTTRTKLAADGAADFSVTVKVSQPDAELRGKLLAPDGKSVGEFDLARQTDGAFAAELKVAKPQLWTAETPALYRLRLSLSSKGKPLQTIEQHVGLREISIKDAMLLLNGRPIKLRGADHHDMDPIDGRAITEAEMRRDLELMKKGNINFIRTSHYAPQPRFIELCDELGFYVMCEVAIGKGENHMNDPAYRDNIMARTDATITRDKNHASVIVWSIGNENPITDLLLDAGRRAKELDPSRPICYPAIGSYFDTHSEGYPEFVDIYAPHYPTNAMLRRFAEKLKRPVILTEYAHAWGLATDRIQEQWDILQKTPTFAGGAIWHFQDQGILHTVKTPHSDFRKPLGSVWLDKNSFYDTHDGDGCDGIVYTDRTPQADFWQTRKVYSPVQIAERAAAVKPGAQEIALNVENRYDFRALTGIKLAWSLQRNGAELQQGDVSLRAAAHEQESVKIPVTIPANASADALALNLRCVDENGLQITERAVRLDFPEAHREAWLAALPAAGKPGVTETDTEFKIDHPHWMLAVTRANGALTIRDRAGRVLVAGIYPHAGRKLTMAEERASKKTDPWRTPMLTEVPTPDVKVTQERDTVRLAVSGTYPRPGAPEQSFVGGYQAEIAPSGAITISYDYAPTNAKGLLTEAGLSIVLPPELTEFRWIGQGIYPGYPGKDRLDEFGIFHLNREDLRFQGNRRETELALLTTPKGAGIALATQSADVSVERDGDTTRLSHNAAISGLGNKGTSPETTVEADKTPHIAGTLTLVPLDDAWPEPLMRWFGKPAAASDVFRPFYHSYDQ